MHVKQKLLSCIDCVVYAANGEIPPERPDLLVDIRARLGADMAHLCYDGEEQIDFSWRPCQCCGSPLGGSRETLAVLAE